MLKYLLIFLFITPALQGTTTFDGETVKYSPWSEADKALMEKIHALRWHQNLVHSRLITLCGRGRYNKYTGRLLESHKEEDMEVLKKEGLIDEKEQPAEGVCSWLKSYDDMTTLGFKGGEKEIIIEEVKN